MSLAPLGGVKAASRFGPVGLFADWKRKGNCFCRVTAQKGGCHVIHFRNSLHLLLSRWCPSRVNVAKTRKRGIQSSCCGDGETTQISTCAIYFSKVSSDAIRAGCRLFVGQEEQIVICLSQPRVPTFYRLSMAPKKTRWCLRRRNAFRFTFKTLQRLLNRILVPDMIH